MNKQRILLPIPDQRSYNASANKDRDICWTDPLVLSLYTDDTVREIAAYDSQNFTTDRVVLELMKFLDNFRPRAQSIDTVPAQRQRAINSIVNQLRASYNAMNMRAKSVRRVDPQRNPWNHLGISVVAPVYDKTSPFSSAHAGKMDNGSYHQQVHNMDQVFEQRERVTNTHNFNVGSLNAVVQSSRNTGNDGHNPAWLSNRSFCVRANQYRPSSSDARTKLFV